MAESKLFFGASTGRTATMHLANVLNSEENCLCLHEGKVRSREQAGDEVLPFLTLENRVGYEYPERREEIINEKRACIDSLVTKYDYFGDIAYNNSPFLPALAKRFPQSRFLVIFRDGRSFVRSAALADGEDEVPAGWAPNNKPLTQLERYISLGRWQPRKGSSLQAAWQNWDYFQKNTWLWAETNKVLLEDLEGISPERFLMVKFEDFVANKIDVYREIRQFLGFSGPLPENVEEILVSKGINSRPGYTIPAYGDWAAEDKEFFWQIAGTMMQRLGYKE